MLIEGRGYSSKICRSPPRFKNPTYAPATEPVHFKFASDAYGDGKCVTKAIGVKTAAL